MIFAIDPGNTYSAYVLYDPEAHDVQAKGKLENYDMLKLLAMQTHDGECQFVIEMIASYGMPVGKDVFETCLWIGRFLQEIETQQGVDADLIYRKSVKMHLCNSVRAKDSNIRQAIIDLFPASGGGKTPQVGTKSEPGPLFGVSADIWAALGVALTHADQSPHHEKRVV